MRPSLHGGLAAIIETAQKVSDMKILKAGETGSKSTVVDTVSNVVRCKHVSTHPSLPKDAKYNVTWNMDLSNLTEEQKAEAAAEYFLIKVRRDFVKAGVTRKDGKVVKTVAPSDDDWDNAIFDCAKYVTKRESREEKMLKALSQFSDDELAAWGLQRAAADDITEDEQDVDESES